MRRRTAVLVALVLGGGPSGSGLPGAKTNQQNGLLNGPADNPKSSCLSCHAQAGMPQDQVPMAPGVTSNEQWETFKGASLDFSQQMRLAKDHYETTKK